MLRLFPFIICALFACSGSNLDEPIEQLESKTKLKYLALGDSYTIGQGVSELERWPNILTAKLNESDTIISETKIIAKTGWTTNNLLSAIENEAPTDYDLVSLLIGVNNQYRGQDFGVYEQEFDSLLNIAIEIAGNSEMVFVVSIPDYGVTPFGQSNAEKIAEELDDYNEYAKKVCETQNIPFVDITEISRQMGNNYGALAPDNLHPSGNQYRNWVEKIYPVVLNLID
ncbi:MAG: SGNH/GDSL hydrolase family protein [Bacteroidia bacterium]